VQHIVVGGLRTQSTNKAGDLRKEGISFYPV